MFMHCTNVQINENYFTGPLKILKGETEHTKIMSHLRCICRDFCSLPCTVCISTHESLKELFKPCNSANMAKTNCAKHNLHRVIPQACSSYGGCCSPP